MSAAPLRVAFDLTGLELDAAGSARAISGLRRELERRPDVELLPLGHGASRLSGPGARVLRGLHRELVYMPFQLPRRAARARADLLHCPVGVAPVRSGLPLVVTVNDVMALEHPEWFTRANSLQQRIVLTRTMRGAARVLTPTGYTRDRLAETRDVDPERIDVVPYGLEPIFRPGPAAEETLDRLGIARPYVVTVGTLQPRKNLAAAVHAFARLVADGVPHTLVVVGARGWHDEPVLDALDDPSVRDRVRLAGRVKDDDLVELYRGADCLVFPSLYEGFGFPALEAMACGTPVVCSNRTSLPEVVGDAAALTDPGDIRALETALAELLGAPDRRRALAAAGLARTKQFSWERSGDLVVAAYERALHR